MAKLINIAVDVNINNTESIHPLGGNLPKFMRFPNKYLQHVPEMKRETPTIRD